MVFAARLVDKHAEQVARWRDGCRCCKHVGQQQVCMLLTPEVPLADTYASNRSKQHTVGDHLAAAQSCQWVQVQQ